MAGRASTPRIAEWMALAVDLADDLAQAPEHLTIGQVSDLTGLAASTISDTLTRRAITHEDNPRIAICRPDFRIGPMPLWSREQVEEYGKIKAGKPGDEDLPTVTPGEAARDGLVTTAEIRERLDVHDQTLRRYQRSSSSYPPAVGRLSREGSPGVPEHLRRWEDVLTWALRQQGLEVPQEWRAKEAS